jgi:predicted alpha/beta-hydrolase family hydrolase
MHMNAVIFGGMSPRHREWVRKLAEALRPEYDIVHFLMYRHWDRPGMEMDLEYEISQAARLAQQLDDYVVIAKSIGTVLTTFAYDRKLLVPKRCVFMGFPLTVVNAEFPQVAGALPYLPSTVFVQNEYDPLGTVNAVKTYVRAHAPKTYDVQATPGTTHDYVDFSLIVQLATKD